MELSRDDHKAVHGMTPGEMHRAARQRSVDEIVRTLDAHVDSGDGWCASALHAGEPQRHPCRVRYHFEGVLNDLRRENY